MQSREKCKKRNSQTNDKTVTIPLERFVMIIILPVVLSFIANLFYDGYKSAKNNTKELFDLPRQVAELNDKIENVEERLVKIENTTTNNNNNSNNNSNNNINTNTNDINNTNSPIINIHFNNLQPTNDGTIEISKVSEELACLLIPPSWSKTDIIAINTVTNEEYTAAQLANEKILLPYKIDGQDYFFYGQFNDNNQWDGNCIVNIYQNNELKSIMDAIYNNGELISYKQAMITTTKSGDKVWSVGKRKREIIQKEEYNSGETWNYFYVDLKQDFDFENVNEENIFNIDKFEEILKGKTSLEGYYNGNTSNGSYNDNTGEAYIIKYFNPNIINENDTLVIRTLYKGKFVDGDFEDDTYNAWYITRELNTTYMYFKGCFLDGEVDHKDKTKEEFENYLTHNQIDEYLRKYGFQEYSNKFLTEYDN